MRRTTFTLIGAAALTLAYAACGNPTRGVPVDATMAFEGAGAGTLTTFDGWAVELTEARAVLGPVYAYAPLDDDVGAMARALSPGIARAHGGLDPLDGREVRAELLDAIEVDLLGARTEALPIAALEGAVDTVTVVLADPPSADGPTHGHPLWIAGVARRGDEEVAFEGGLDLGDDPVERRVDDVAVSGAMVEGARLVLRVNPDGWLGEARFDEPFEDGAQPYRAWRIAARSASRFSMEIE